MATITFDAGQAVFYRAGVSGVSRVVGTDYVNNNHVTRVARYTFNAPAEGANHVDLTFCTYGAMEGSTHIPIRFFISTDPDSYANAGATYDYTGELTLGTDYTTFTGAADILLLPSETYYLWVFPGDDDTFGCYSWYHNSNVSTMETSGSAGIIYLDKGTSVEGYLANIDKGDHWEQFIPNKEDGTSWNICS